MHQELKRRIERCAQQAGRPPTPSASLRDEAWQERAGKAGEYLSVIDLDLRIVLNNRRQEGVTSADGALATDYLDPAYHGLFMDTVAAAYTSGVPQYFEILGTGPNGETVGYRSWVLALFERDLPEARAEDTSTLFAVISVDISHVGRVERELANQTSVLESLARDAPDNIMILDRESRILFNNHWLEDFGSAEQVLGKPAWSFLPEPHQALARTKQESVVRTGESTAYEVPLELAEGTRWYNTRAGPIMRDGQVERILLISTDVTAARQQEAEAARERAALDVLERLDRCILAASELEPMIDGVLEVIAASLDAARVGLSCPCTPEAATWSLAHEYKAAELPALRGATLTVTPAYRAHLTATLAGGTVHGFAPAADDPSFSRGAIRCVASMALRPRPGPVWLLSLQRSGAEPLSRQERALLERLGLRLSDGLRNMLARRDLSQSEERFRTLVEHAPEAIVILDVDASRFVEANGNAEKLMAMSRTAICEADPLSLAPQLQPDGRTSAAVIREKLSSALRGETPTFEWLQVDANGRAALCEVRLVRLPHPEKRLVRGSLTDITDRKRAEEERRALAAQLAQAQKMQSLGQLTGGIAHDFNNLLTVIIGSLAMLEADERDRPQVREMVQQADAAAQRAAALTQRLLAFSRRQPLRPQSIDTYTLLPGMELLLRRTLPENITLSLQVEPHCWPCEADPAQLESAVLNLAINARDAMPRGGTLRISAQNALVDADCIPAREGLTPGAYVAISVRDSGTGMTPDVLAQAFEPFFTTKGVGQGSGLGLSMVYGFAKQSGGHVRIVSAPGQGTEVQLHLPRSRRTGSAPGLPASKAPDGGTGQLLLVVEDDPGVRLLVCEMLRRLGYQTIAAEDGPSALLMLRTRDDVALMLTDMALPGGMSGAELVSHVKQHRPALPVLFMTGYSKDAVANDQPGTQGVQLLPKPFSKAALASAVREALGVQRERVAE